MSLEALAGVLPPGAVSVAHADRLAVSADLWPRHILGLWQGKTAHLPAGVVWPQSVAELQEVAAFAHAKGIPLVPYGAGSSVVGGATPDQTSLVVDFKRMTQVHEIDAKAGIATAEAGLMGELFERMLNREGLTCGHFPSSIYTSSVGGWVAARGAGQMSSRYGKIEDMVLGGKVVLGDGTLLEQKPSPVTTPMFDALVGSEGALGLWAEATLRVLPLPEHRLFWGVSFPSVPKALAAAQAWLRAGLNLCVVRIYDPLDSFLHKTTHTHEGPRDKGPSPTAWIGAHAPRVIAAAARLLGPSCRAVIGLQGSQAQTRDELHTLLDIAQTFGGMDLGQGPGDAWFSRRYAVSYKQSNALRAGVLVDTMEVACTWDRVVPVYEAVRRAGLACGAQVLAHFSHVYLEGASIYFTYAMPAKRGEAAYMRLWEWCLRAAVDHGANVSHHHGVGRLKDVATTKTLGGGAGALRTLARELDPKNILNPGVLTARFDTHDSASFVPRRPTATGLALPVAPQTRIKDLEAELARQNQSLGAVATLFPKESVLDVARRGVLWRHNPLTRVLEPILMGVDATVDGAVTQAVPAPRAAMGPNLSQELLRSDVQRLWLRALPTYGAPLGWTDSAMALCDELAVICTHEQLGAGNFSLHVSGTTAALQASFVAGPLLRTQTNALTTLLGAPESRESIARSVDLTKSIDDTALFFTTTWRGLREVLRAVERARLSCVIPFIDAAGGAGFVSGSPGVTWDAATRTSFASLLRELGADASLSRTPRSPRSSTHNAVLDVKAKKSKDNVLALAPHEGALDNCTYCPKLCRFSCPVSEGNEALTPRQMMLTASLDRRGAQPLSDDTATRLYACVDCKGCKSFCDHANDVATVLTDARAELWQQDRAPTVIREVLDTLRTTGRLPDRPLSDVPHGQLPATPANASTALFLGCQNGLSDAPNAEATLNLVQRTEGPTRVLPPLCCGQPLWRWGDREAFAAHAKRVGEAVGSAETLVVDDPGCAYALETLYAQVGVQLPKVRTVTSLLDAPIDAQGAVPQDNCFSQRYLGEPTLRSQCDGASSKGSVLEGQAGCCGGMLLPLYDPALAERVAKNYAQDLLGAGSSIITASPTCKRRLASVDAPVRGILEPPAKPNRG